MQGFGRLPEGAWGRLIDRKKPLRFRFDGTSYPAFQGDVIASALYAGGRTTLSRSFKYHRPRGALTMAGHDVNTFIQVGDEPNVRADRYAVAAGLEARSINRLGSLDWDWLAGIGTLSHFLPVGFYYKTFFRPHGAWQFFEKLIRRTAGLGELDADAAYGEFDKAYLFADVLVVGGGPAGLAAAIASAEAGADTLLIDEWPELGGSILYSRGGDGQRATLVAAANAQPNLRIMRDTTVTGLFADNWAAAVCGNRLYKIRSRQTVLATGAFDQPFVFKNNDLPGILFADAVQRLMRLYAVRPGSRAVVVTVNRFGYDAALDLIDAGVEVAAVADLRPVPENAETVTRLTQRGVSILTAAAPVAARGSMRVSGIGLSRLIGEGRTDPIVDWIECDLVVMSAGYAPALNLASYAGAKVIYDAELSTHRAVALPPGLLMAGSAAGVWTDAIVSEDATRVGRTAALRVLNGRSDLAHTVLADPLAKAITHPYPILVDAARDGFIDFDEDLKTGDILDAMADGYDDIQLVKRYSTVGIGPSQGRHSNLNTIRLVARASGKSPAEIGTTTFRPPLVPEKFGHMAGRAFEPVRLTALHQRHVALGAKMMVAGPWLRPAYYGGSSDVIAGEVRAVREAAGIIDVSTLGKLDIRGPDAAQFMERVYTGNFAKQPVGRARYALMCDETGVIVDDGVAGRLHAQHFYVTTTTGAIDQVWRHMTYLNTQWQLDVDIANVTGAYAAINLAGPKARDVIAGLATDIDFSASAFPYMGVRWGMLAGAPVRVARVGFVGELGYEIHVPSGYAAALWDALAAAGAAHGLKPFGVEAQRILRLEKGHIIVGQDTDGLTNPLEAAMGWALGKSKQFFVGQRSLAMHQQKGIKRQLVPFTVTDAGAPVPRECHLVIRDGDIAGRVTSVVRSPTLGHVIGLAYVEADKTAPGSEFAIRADGGALVLAVVTSGAFYDPDNARQEL